MGTLKSRGRRPVAWYHGPMLGPKVLVADNDSNLRRRLLQELAARGYEAGEVTTLKAAVEQHRKMTFDAIIIDGFLPDAKGTAGVEALRNVDRNVRILYTTGFWRDAQTFEKLTKQLGVHKVLYKPVEPKALADVVDALVGRPKEATQETQDESQATLKRTFADALPEKLAELEETLVRIEEGALTLLDEALFYTRRLATLAQTYAKPHIAEAMHTVEKHLREVSTIENAKVHSKGSLDAVRKLMNRATSDSDTSFAPEFLVVGVSGTSKQLVSLYARRHNLACEFADNASQALEVSQSRRISSVLITSQIARENEFGFIRHFLSQRGNQRVPVAIVVHGDDLDRRLEALQAGARLFVDDPLTEASLAETISRLADEASRHTELALVLEPDPQMLASIREVLSDMGVRTAVCSDAGDLLTQLDGERPSALILGEELPHLSGMDLCRAVRAHSRWFDLPVIIVGESNEPSVRVRAYRSGATDYIARPLITDEVAARLGSRLAEVRFRQDHRADDPITGLMTHKAFVDLLAKRASEYSRYGQAFSLALLQLHDVKTLRMVTGRQGLEDIQRHLAALLVSNLRTEDLAARWDEYSFAILFPQTTNDGAVIPLKRLATQLKTAQPLKGAAIQPSFTAAIASFPADGTNVSQVLVRAQARLDASAQGGPGRIITNQS